MTEYVKDIQHQITTEISVDDKNQIKGDDTISIPKTRQDFVKEMLQSSKKCKKKSKDQLLVGFLNNNNK